MKRILATLVIVLAAASAVSAQSEISKDWGFKIIEPAKHKHNGPGAKAKALSGTFACPISVATGPAGLTIGEILDSVRSYCPDFQYAFKADTDRKILSIRVSLDSGTQPLGQFLDKLITYLDGYSVQFRGNTAVIHGPAGHVRLRTESAAKEYTPAEQISTQAPAVQPPIPTYVPPLPHVPETGYFYVGRNRPAYLYQTLNYGYGQNRYHGYTGYYGYYLDCSVLPDNRACTHGELRIDGPRGEKWLQGIDLYINYDNYGPASKFNRWPNDGAVVPVGEGQIVQFVRVSDDMVVYETRMNIRSRYVMKGEPNIIRLDEDRMERGPHRRRIRQVPNQELPLEPAGDVLPLR